MYIYFIKAGKYLKIGISEDPEKRLSQLQTGSPLELSLIDKVKVRSESEAKAIESAMHIHFRGKRIKGEWFKGVTSSKATRICREIVSDGKERKRRSAYRYCVYALAVSYCVALFFYV